MTIILRFFPNGEFTQGVDTSKKRKRHQHSKRNLSTAQATVAEKYTYLTDYALSANGDCIDYYTPGQQFKNYRNGIYTYLCEDSIGHHFAYEETTHVIPDVVINEPIAVLIARGEMTPLVYQSVESSPKASRKKLESMTNNMRRNIRQGVYLLEHKYSKDLLSFLTLTLPDLSHEDLGKCCERWDYMVDQFLKYLRKRLEKSGIIFEYVYCTEIQTKRLQNNGEYAPHLHLVYNGRRYRKAPWAVTPKQVRKAWTSIIANVVGHREFCSDALENLQRVKFSAARYLSKYISKGCNTSTCAKEVTQCAGRLKTQWGGMARTISTAIKKCTSRITSHDPASLAAAIMRSVDYLVELGIVKYFRTGYIPLSSCAVDGVGRVLKVGVGCLSTPLMEGGLEAVASHLRGQWETV